ncbi:MAG: hypothetical protein QXO15_05495 [Nitrososphaerota archaeon]
MPKDRRHISDAYDRGCGLIPIDPTEGKTCADCGHYVSRQCLVRNRSFPPTKIRCRDFRRRGL